MSVKIGIDVGGTFTDLTIYDPHSGAVTAFKAPSDRSEPDNGVMAALEKAGIDLAACALVVHGTTVATNTLLERSPYFGAYPIFSPTVCQ